MKIGIDGRLWNETGVGRYIRNLVENIQEIDTKNEYVLFLQEKDAKKFNVQSSKFKIIATDVRWHSVEEQVQFPRVLYKENLDLMHFTYFSLPIFYTKPFVVTIHDLIINHFPTGKASTLPYPLYQMKRMGYDFVMDHAVKHSEKIIVPLNAVKDDVMQTFTISGGKITVTYEGVESRIMNHESRKNMKYEIPNTKYFMYVGNAYPHKNLEKLIEAFIAFKKESKDEVKLILVGKDDYFYKRLRDRIEKEKLENIIIKHNVSDEELFTLYTHALAFVSPSLMEGFGLPPLEAMSASCSVLVSDIPSFREVCQESAFYFDPSSKESLKQQLQFVYNLDHKKKEAHIQNGLNRVKEFSWKRMAEQTLKVYESSISLR
jgi:glycosyltransferase involved in cell wall biosynthesis